MKEQQGTGGDADGRLRKFLRNLKHALAAVTSKPIRFERLWKKSNSEPSPDIGGRWLGEWLSNSNGHHGKLRCILNSTGQSKYQALFHARYARFLRVSYRVDLFGHKLDNAVQLQGSVDLGALAGGVYHYDGLATPTDFRCSYRCKYDWGTFSLQRPDPNTSRPI